MTRIILTTMAAMLVVFALVFGLWQQFAEPEDRADSLTPGPSDALVGVPEPRDVAPVEAAPVAVPLPADAVALTVERIVDGDTIRAVAPGGDGESLRIRLIGIDTPEMDPTQCWAPEATDALAALIPPGSTVWAAPDVEDRDRYDRLLRYLWTPDGRFVNLELAAAGAADTLSIAPNTTHAATLAASVAAAQQAGTGMWGACG
ncbi:thermonuclease family protein [Microbacterium sp. zg.Y1090]|uniref:thermonuclease family protein n=1 Tax=Microbacterium wangruii TaxID=3049073 RepID=UPI00214DC8EC|nr:MULTISPECIES: thermonuclease family protein [unclassified Microbacterium]MCR2819689.1 thermonuclease family protein [Microbacterium sp. zg.Y1090]MDL5487537.1 thermonuclease family protein [Microbacterium sp. zg-Y1211]WIM28067.1 thermonuclease family protein [Microbacterium sp. zg-Y1090]